MCLMTFGVCRRDGGCSESPATQLSYMHSSREERNSQAVLFLAPPEGAERRNDVCPEAESATSDIVSSKRDNHPITGQEFMSNITEFYSCC